MKRARKKQKGKISSIVPKNHFVSMRFFREKPLINWQYTDTVLFTAYDVYRSSDFWVDSVINSGSSLKEALVGLGFPKKNTLLADTGIFEIEAKKAGIARRLGIEVQIELSNDQIFEAYNLSGADLFVSPDEIILATDTNEKANEKIRKIQSNMLDALEHFPVDKMIGVLQGIEQKRVEGLFDFYRSHGVDKFAIGGILPLYWHDKSLFNEVLAQTRKLTKDYWLHTFGLPLIKLLPFYLQEMNMDSVDTSMLLYLTARRRYLVGVESRPVRLANFEICGCLGCQKLQDNRYTRSTDFFVSLYIHNLIEASLVAKMCIEGSWNQSARTDLQIDTPSSTEEDVDETVCYKPIRDYDGQWITSDVLLDDLNQDNEQ